MPRPYTYSSRRQYAFFTAAGLTVLSRYGGGQSVDGELLVRELVVLCFECCVSGPSVMRFARHIREQVLGVEDANYSSSKDLLVDLGEGLAAPGLPMSARPGPRPGRGFHLVFRAHPSALVF